MFIPFSKINKLQKKNLWKSSLWSRIYENILCQNLRYGTVLIKIPLKISAMVKYMKKKPLWSQIDQNIAANISYDLGLLVY